MVETIFSCVVAVICMFPVFIFGAVQYHSKKPVIFWAGTEPPTAEQLTDVKAVPMDIWRRDCRRYRISRRSAGFNLVS